MNTINHQKSASAIRVLSSIFWTVFNKPYGSGILHAQRRGLQTHNVKNNLLCNAQKQILWLSRTFDGSVYDKEITDEQPLRLPQMCLQQRQVLLLCGQFFSFSIYLKYHFSYIFEQFPLI
jgi:hypothetical protein